MLAFLGLELHAEGFFQGGADGGEGGEVAGVLDAGAGVAGVGGEEEGDVARVIERRGVEQDALEVFDEAFAQGVGGFAWVGGGGPEGGFAVGQAEGFQLPRGSCRARF